MTCQFTVDWPDDAKSAAPRGPGALDEHALAAERRLLRLIARDMPLPELLAELCLRAEKLLGEQAICSILLLDADGESVRVGGAPSLPAGYRMVLDRVLMDSRAAVSTVSMRERRVVVVEDILADPLWAQAWEAARDGGVRACWSAPLETEAGELLGALAVYHRSRWRPGAAEQALLHEISHSAAAVVNQEAIARRLAHSEEYHRLVVNHLSEGILVLSRDGTILACNLSAQRILGAPPDVAGRSMLAVIPRMLDEDGVPLPVRNRPSMRALATGKAVFGQTVGLDLAGRQVVWVSLNTMPIFRPGEAEPASVMVSFADVSPAREAQQRLRYLATRDSLTGLHNRAYLSERLREMLGDAGGSLRLAVLFIDLDGFKKVNETAGHEAGDALLHSVAQRLAGCVREGNALARVGGDEFVIAVGDHTHAGEPAALARHVLDTLAAPFALAGNEYFLGASIGISVYPGDGQDASALIRYADSAMHVAKQSGGNTFQFFTEDLSQRLQRRFTIEQSLRRALACAELSLVYQPFVNSRNGRVVGAEALLRWTSGELGEVSPAEFIPVAEEAGLIAEIGHWALRQACRQAARWRRSFAPDFVMAVNLSPRQFTGALVGQVMDCLAQTCLAPAALELEITEGLLMSESEDVQPILRALSDRGIRISVDDFGTGYSSLAYLNRFTLHNLKVDRSFVAGLPDNRDAVAITQAVVAMAHSLGMHVTAEGVETAAQAAFLKALGCERQQGYLFSRPVSAAACSRMLREQGKAQR
ncbi:putative bifunctional diguanylate cyclase/phosphodiesterase [Cupriavidus sp. 30B13]|uniref:putative bifunctional diguanylate cyclase/phosphodiesterase n=1 Tax=Cupriavidus sp. 30B13 TaxID=3384241 RepID=UPI003B90D140